MLGIGEGTFVLHIERDVDNDLSILPGESVSSASSVSPATSLASTERTESARRSRQKKSMSSTTAAAASTSRSVSRRSAMSNDATLGNSGSTRRRRAHTPDHEGKSASSRSSYTGANVPSANNVGAAAAAATAATAASDGNGGACALPAFLKRDANADATAYIQSDMFFTTTSLQLRFDVLKGCAPNTAIAHAPQNPAALHVPFEYITCFELSYLDEFEKLQVHNCYLCSAANRLWGIFKSHLKKIVFF